MTQLPPDYTFLQKLPVCITRPVLNPEDLLYHYESFGYPRDLMDAPGGWHVTVLYSRQPINWITGPQPDHNCVMLNQAERAHNLFDTYGHYKAHVLCVESRILLNRHEELRQRTGATHDYPDLKLHITVGRSEPYATSAWTNCRPYAGSIVLGPERWKPIGVYPKFES